MQYFKIIALIAYALIILMGSMIGIPFLMWLFCTSFDFGNIDQPFAIIGLIGFILNFTKYINARNVRVLSFLLMLTPIIRRLTAIDINKFNYVAFTIPLLIFTVSYLIFIISKPKLIAS